jgi:hypothetical protein
MTAAAQHDPFDAQLRGLHMTRTRCPQCRPDGCPCLDSLGAERPGVMWALSPHAGAPVEVGVVLGTPRCARCRDQQWVCEEHDDRPWNGGDGCGAPSGWRLGEDCGGAGMPCPDCNPLSLAAAPMVTEHMAAMRAELEARQAFEAACAHTHYGRARAFRASVQELVRAIAVGLRELAAALDGWAAR